MNSKKLYATNYIHANSAYMKTKKSITSIDLYHQMTNWYVCNQYGRRKVEGKKNTHTHKL
jgi:hypothetical protein